jgi:hypothetical protein
LPKRRYCPGDLKIIMDNQYRLIGLKQRLIGVRHVLDNTTLTPDVHMALSDILARIENEIEKLERALPPT